MNLALLEKHAAGRASGLAGDWLFVVGLIVLLLVMAAIPFVLAGWLIGALGRILT